MEQKQLEKLEELYKLKEKGILTEEEFTEYKDKIIHGKENKKEDTNKNEDINEKVPSVIWWLLCLLFVFLMIVSYNTILIKEYTEKNTKCTDTECTDLNGNPITGILKMHDDGKVKAEMSFKNGQLDGVSKFYNKNGNIQSEETYIHGERIEVKEYYENNQISTEMLFKDGKIEGLVKYYYESGALRCTMHYKNGELEGTSKCYYENGNLESEEFYKNGELNGTVKKI